MNKAKRDYCEGNFGASITWSKSRMARRFKNLKTISPPRIELSLALFWTFMNGNFLTITLFPYFKEMT